MNIIFGNEYNLDSKHILLELDTIRVGSDGPERTAYCIIQHMPIEEIPIVENLKELHQSLIATYRNKNWSKCEQLIEQLTGKWNGEVDTFYQDLQVRISSLQQQNPGPDWSPIIQK
jgi:hypothetical protein